MFSLQRTIVSRDGAPAPARMSGSGDIGRNGGSVFQVPCGVSSSRALRNLPDAFVVALGRRGGHK
jgi:hypothetical protein